MPRIECDGFPDLNKIVQPGWRVADYGGGTNPFAGAHVVVDVDPGGWEGKDARALGIEVRTADVQDLRGVVADKEFDFVVASHIAEHVENPVAFCRELMRTAKGGYVEAPSPFYEVFFQWSEHKWLVEAKGDVLCFRQNTQENCPGRAVYNAFGGTGPYEHVRSLHEPNLRTRFLWERDFRWRVES